MKARINIWPYPPLPSAGVFTADVDVFNFAEACPVCLEPMDKHKFNSIRSSSRDLHFECPEPPTPMELLARTPLEEECTSSQSSPSGKRG